MDFSVVKIDADMLSSTRKRVHTEGNSPANVPKTPPTKKRKIISNIPSTPEPVTTIPITAHKVPNTPIASSSDNKLRKNDTDAIQIDDEKSNELSEDSDEELQILRNQYSLLIRSVDIEILNNNLQESQQIEFNYYGNNPQFSKKGVDIESILAKLQVVLAKLAPRFQKFDILSTPLIPENSSKDLLEQINECMNTIMYPTNGRGVCASISWIGNLSIIPPVRDALRFNYMYGNNNKQKIYHILISLFVYGIVQ
eukprot:202195_1